MSDLDTRRDFSRLETKVDRIQEAIVSLARMEERLITLFKRIDAADVELREARGRIAELERTTHGRGAFFRWADRIGVALVGALIGLMITTMKSGL